MSKYLVFILSAIIFGGCTSQTAKLAAIQDGSLTWPSKAVVQLHDSNKTVRFLKGKNLSRSLKADENFRQLQKKNQFADIALAFISAHRLTFKLIQPAQELKLVSVQPDNLGLKHVKFSQFFKNVPVWGAQIIVHLNKDNQVYLVQGGYIPTPLNTQIQPKLNREQAFEQAARALSISQCPKCKSEMVLLETLSGTRLTYKIQAVPSLSKSQIFFVDAVGGDILKILPAVQTIK